MNRVFFAHLSWLVGNKNTLPTLHKILNLMALRYNRPEQWNK
ncbi:MAG: hypothetical protein ABFS56_23610 [Pseudomonadota bacterium]